MSSREPPEATAPSAPAARVCNMLEGVKSYRDESVKDFIVKDCPLYHHHLSTH